MSGDKKTVGFRSEFFRGRHRRGYMRGKQGVFSKFGTKNEMFWRESRMSGGKWAFFRLAIKRGYFGHV
ncbi:MULTISPECIES: hypothetical protein [Lachnospiraceae]|jgi:hypothetical protein|uniref:hypothetical protein n=1 Tax=Lachnospiraceae TaxID=186803 RepID=UPI000E4AEA62|nr:MULTISPECIES: hypothetical protein [Lachnospiraceae]RHR47918.1 hypothetical protein DWX00_14225 [Blautia sp. AF17-9LB]